ncbi:VanZ family protein [Kitasatospora sp. NPDC051914]|uniref:VanZ family protein n=1 Tax=Kitasatospora sp. NPDC051914 TaxID=3154945 RepID=UPI00341BEF9A
MSRTAALSAPARRARRAVFVALAVPGAAAAAFVLQRSLRHHGGGWHEWVGTISGVVLLTVAALPVAALTVWMLAHRRRASGTTPAWAWRKSLAEVGIVYGTVPWIWMIMLPGGGAGAAPRRVNPVPLRDLLTILAGSPATATVQIVGNLLVFAALGYLAPLRFAALASLPRILALAAGCSVLVETAQYFLWLDRVSSVDDVLLNAAGAALAAPASRRSWRVTAGAGDGAAAG